MRKKQKGVVTLLILFMFSGLTACGTGTALQPDPSKTLGDSEIPSAAAAQTYVENDCSLPKRVSYKEYEAFGLQFDEGKNELFFDGELVRYFYDGVELSDGAASVCCEYLNKKGTVDVYTVREPVTNQDGSMNPLGKLTGIERYSQDEFDRRDLSDLYGSSDAVTYATGFYDPTAESFTERFAKYREFGIEYVEAQNASGAGNIYYHGKPVNAFLDIAPDGGTFTFQSADGGEINVKTVYENGKITGVEEVQ